MRKETSEIKAVKKDRGKAASLEALQNTAGGKVLIGVLKEDIASVVEELARSYRILSHIEMLALCAKLDEKLKVLKSLNRAPKNKKLCDEELERLLNEPEENL